MNTHGRAALGMGSIVVGLFATMIEGHEGGDDDYSHPAIERVEESAIKPWTDKPFYNDPDNFQFAIVSDRTGGHRDGVFPAAMDKVNLVMPEMVLSVGDLIEGGYADPDRVDEEWEEFTSFVDKLEMPFYYLPGNHDIWNPMSKRKWQERFGVTYYHRVYKDVLFLHLNTLDGGRAILSEAQRTYFKEVLEKNQDVRWTIVLMHEPLWVYEENRGSDGSTGWRDIEQQLQERDYTVFAGHFHYYRKYVRNKSNYFILATTGGGTGLEGPKYGGFDHFVWVTMTDDGPRLANLELNGIHDENVSTEESYSTYRPLTSGPRVAAEAVYFDRDGKLESNEFNIRIHNQKTLPLEIEGQFNPSDAFAFEPSIFKAEVDSGATVELPIKVTALDTLKKNRVVPIHYRATYRPEGLEESRLEYEARFSAWNKIELTQNNRVKVDGDLKEWKSLPYVINDLTNHSGLGWMWDNEQDGSFRFGVATDRKGNLYLAASIVDEKHVTNYSSKEPEKLNFTRCDSMIFRIDSRPDPERSLNENAPDKAFEEFLPIQMVAAGKDDAIEWTETLKDSDRMPNGVETKLVATNDGFAAEVMIPAEVLDAMHGSPWEDVRIQAAYYDTDDKRSQGTVLLWQPKWQKRYGVATNLPGSGTFTRRSSR